MTGSRTTNQFRRTTREIVASLIESLKRVAVKMAANLLAVAV